ncbi:MAG: DUF2953 domain-containing protein [Lachnospirales bacterium]
MISAALWLLKIIGILLLVLFALLLLAVLLVLFSAVCYQAEGSYLGNTLKANGKISWLFHILTIRFSFEERVYGDVRIFGIPVWSTDKKGAEKPNETQPEMENGPEDFQPEEEVFSIQELGTETGDRDRGIPELSGTKQHKAEPEQEEAEPKPEESFLETWIRRLSEKSRSLFQKGKQMAADGKRRFRRAMAQKEKLVSWIEDEANQESVKLVVRQLGKIIRHLLPRKGHGRVTFGFGEDPYLTGKVLTAIAPFYPLYGEYLELYPDFERRIFEAEGTGNGHIRIGVIIGYAIRLLFDSNIRKNIRAFMRR